MTPGFHKIPRDGVGEQKSQPTVGWRTLWSVNSFAVSCVGPVVTLRSGDASLAALPTAKIHRRSTTTPHFRTSH